jgi:hypothetical protein
MKLKGQEGEPFQLLIGMIVFGMALFIGYYIFDMVNCWKCNELLKTEAVDLREAITSVGKGDTNSKKMFSVDIQNLGSCAQGIYLRHVESEEGLSCKNFCPSHPNSCWAIITESSCGDKPTEIECIDINGDTDIEPEADFSLSKSTGEGNQWLEDAWFFSHTMFIRIEKTSATTIAIGKP